MRKTLIVLLALTRMTLAAPPTTSPMPPSRIHDNTTLLEGNQLACFFPNNGNFAYDRSNVRGQSDGLYYPNNWPTDIRTVVYDAGLWLTGITAAGDTLVAVAEYSSEFAPGGFGADSSLPEWRVYHITADPATWADWPVAQGAPLAANGADPWIADMPAATEMLFTVFNDGDPAYHNNDAGNTSPMEVEVRMTAWCFDQLGDEKELHVRWELLNQGSHDFVAFNAGIWLDPDLGGPADDLIASQPARSLVLCYNSTDNDASYGATPPAVGCMLFAGLHVPSTGDSAWYGNSWHADEVNLPAAAISSYTNGTDPHHFRQTFYSMQGLDGMGQPRPEGPFAWAGDPVAGTGSLDPAPADKRALLACGPVAFPPGQTQELTAVLAVGQGQDRLESIRDLEATMPLPLGQDQPQYFADPLHFIHVAPDSTALESITIHNPDLLSWVVTSAQSSNPRFQLAAELPLLLPATDPLWLPISFQPEGPEGQAATLTLSMETANTLTLHVSGNGPWLEVMPEGELGVLPPDGLTTDLVIHNVGTEAALLEDVLSSPSIFHSECSLAGVNLLPGDSLECPVTFLSPTSGPCSGSLSIWAVDGEGGPVVGTWTFDYQWWQDETQIWRVDYLAEDGGPGPFAGINWGGRFLGGGVDVGHYFFGSTLPGYWQAPDMYDDVEIEFTSNPQLWSTCATYLRPGYGFQGMGQFPGRAWVGTGESRRRLNICFVETSDSPPNALWDPTTDGVGGREYLFIMDSNYNNGEDYDDDNLGPWADVLWAAWLRRVGEDGPMDGDRIVCTMEHGSDVEEPRAAVRPSGLSILDIAPNPFNPQTQVTFQLAGPVADLRLSLYNVLGQEVWSTSLGEVAAGTHTEALTASGFASGVYVLHLEGGGWQAVRRVLLIK